MSRQEQWLEDYLAAGPTSASQTALSVDKKQAKKHGTKYTSEGATKELGGNQVPAPELSSALEPIEKSAEGADKDLPLSLVRSLFATLPKSVFTPESISRGVAAKVMTEHQSDVGLEPPLPNFRDLRGLTLKFQFPWGQLRMRTSKNPPNNEGENEMEKAPNLCDVALIRSNNNDTSKSSKRSPITVPNLVVQPKSKARKDEDPLSRPNKQKSTWKPDERTLHRMTDLELRKSQEKVARREFDPFLKNCLSVADLLPHMQKANSEQNLRETALGNKSNKAWLRGFNSNDRSWGTKNIQKTH
ncbi:MAG: hypothetical protein MMC33_010016 [Icmadophila ericetorum]|nr:hypothetical protein [Icmadophila ericetorum]